MIQTFLDDLLSVLKNPPGYFVTSVIIMSAIIVFSIVVGTKVSKMNPKDKPSKGLSLVISAIGGFNNLVKEVIGKHWIVITPSVLSLAMYIFNSNISGVTGISTTPTKFSAITFSLSIIAVTTIQMMGFISKGWSHIKSIFEPVPFIAPLNIIGEITPLISLALRLFGNIASGSLIMFLIYKLSGWASLIIAPAFHLVFDIGFGLIQTIVFVLLTLILSSTKIDENDLDYV